MKGNPAVAALLAALLLASGGCRRRGETDRTGASEAESTAEARPFTVEPRAPEGEAIEYTVRFPSPETHYVEVEMVLPTGGADEVELFMPVWTPGSYLVREYARTVEGIEAIAAGSEERLAIDKTRKNRWTVQTGGAERVGVRYRVYSRALSVQSSFVDDEIAVLNGAATFITVREELARPHDVLFEPAEGWEHSITSLRPHADDRAHHYLAETYDELVDSPIVLGSPELHDFEVEGVSHRFANFGGGGVWDGERAATDVQKIVETQVRFWRTVPYDRYVFINLALEGGGGLEHRESTLMITSPWATRSREKYTSWLGLVSHEFFHTWNGKRLRPVELGPFDYENEVYTRSLWVVEGVTSYYDDLLLRRAEQITQDEYLERLSKSIEHVQTSPGREVQSLADSSYDAWIKFYRADESFVNTGISYYRKGAVVGFLLDARIRRESRGTKSLDDVMRLAFERHGGDRGYTPEELRAIVSEVAGAPLDDFFASYVDGTEELDYGPALDWLGLRFTPREEPDEDDPPEELAGHLGAETSTRDGRVVVTEVPRGTPAFAAGLNVEDEVIAIGEHRIPSDGLDARLERYRPGESVQLLVSRRGVLRRIDVTLGAEPEDTWELEVTDLPTASQRRHLEEWLSARAAL